MSEREPERDRERKTQRYRGRDREERENGWINEKPKMVEEYTCMKQANICYIIIYCKLQRRKWINIHGKRQGNTQKKRD